MPIGAVEGIGIASVGKFGESDDSNSEDPSGDATDALYDEVRVSARDTGLGDALPLRGSRGWRPAPAEI